MTIKIYSDRIDIGDFTLFEGNGGVQFGGVARAENFQRTPSHQGFNTGYVVGGRAGTPGFPSPQLKLIEKFPFSTDTSATGVGDRTFGTIATAGMNSETHGYSAGGYGSVPGGGPVGLVNNIDKFPFSVDTNGSDVGNLSNTKDFVNGVSSYVDGYVCGGRGGGNAIDKFPFTTDTNATDVADLADTHPSTCATSASPTEGFIAGASGPPNTGVVISRFPFSNNSNATDIGDLTQGRYGISGQSSSTHGYASGGGGSPVGLTNVIDKWSFSNLGNATDVGDLLAANRFPSGSSSLQNGYNLGGLAPNDINTIQKFPFATDSNTVAQSGTLTSARSAASSGSISR